MSERRSLKSAANAFALIAFSAAWFCIGAFPEQNDSLIPMKDRYQLAAEGKGPFSCFPVAFRKENLEIIEEKGNCLQGRIKKIHPADGSPPAQRILGTILAEGKRGSEIIEAAIGITIDTQIFKEEGGKKKPGNFGDFKVGQWICIQFSGPILQTHPIQGEAKEIIISLERK
jgi:hypothetical protein